MPDDVEGSCRAKRHRCTSRPWGRNGWESDPGASSQDAHCSWLWRQAGHGPQAHTCRRLNTTVGPPQLLQRKASVCRLRRLRQHWRSYLSMPKHHWRQAADAHDPRQNRTHQKRRLREGLREHRAPQRLGLVWTTVHVNVTDRWEVRRGLAFRRQCGASGRPRRHSRRQPTAKLGRHRLR